MSTPVSDSITANRSAQPLVLPRIKNISRADFVKQYVIPRRPCIMEGFTPGWAAPTKWTPDFWRTTYGDKQVEIDGKKLTMREVIAQAIISFPSQKSESERLATHPTSPEFLSA